MLSIFSQVTLDSNEELKAEVFANSEVGNLVPVNLMGDTNGYYIISGYQHSNNTLVAPYREEDESEADYITRLKPISLQGFVDLAMGTIEAIALTNEQLKLLLSQPEFKTDETI